MIFKVNFIITNRHFPKFDLFRRLSTIPRRRFKVLDGRITIPLDEREELEAKRKNYVEEFRKKQVQVMEG